MDTTCVNCVNHVRGHCRAHPPNRDGWPVVRPNDSCAEGAPANPDALPESLRQCLVCEHLVLADFGGDLMFCAHAPEIVAKSIWSPACASFAYRGDTPPRSVNPRGVPADALIEALHGQERLKQACLDDPRTAESLDEARALGVIDDGPDAEIVEAVGVELALERLDANGDTRRWHEAERRELLDLAAVRGMTLEQARELLSGKQ